MISLVATVLNEGESLHRLMRSMVAQTRQADEVVIVDGGSRDDTVAILESYAGQLPLRVVVEAGCNISEGRNRAIGAARGEIIAVTDAGVVLDARWLERLVQPLEDDANCAVVGGFFRPDYQNRFELAMSVTVLPLADEIQAGTFLPSSRSVAFRKAAWAAVGGYPEWLDYCEDLVFDLRLKAAVKTPFAFAGEAVVAFRPRGTLRSYFKQYYLYARGDGKADLWRKRHAARYLTYVAAAPMIALLGAVVHPALWLLALVGGYVYLRQPYQRLGKLAGNGLSGGDRLYVWGMIPVIRVVGDVAKMLGYPVGWRWRLRHDPPDWHTIG